MKRILLFDIDRTLLDTDKMSFLLTSALSKILGEKNLNKINSIKREYIESLKRDREFTPDEFCRRLSLEFNFDTMTLLDVFYGDKYAYIYKESVFPETIQVLDKLKDNYRFGIYSEGNYKFQNRKFDALNKYRHFDKNFIFIVGAKDNQETLEKIPSRSLIVDDKEIVCEFLFKHGIKVIWLNKKDSRKSEKFTTVYNLLELSTILENSVNLSGF